MRMVSASDAVEYLSLVGLHAVTCIGVAFWKVVLQSLFPIRRCGVVRFSEEIHSLTSPHPSLSVDMSKQMQIEISTWYICQWKWQWKCKSMSIKVSIRMLMNMTTKMSIKMRAENPILGYWYATILRNKNNGKQQQSVSAESPILGTQGNFWRQLRKCPKNVSWEPNFRYTTILRKKSESITEHSPRS